MGGWIAGAALWALVSACSSSDDGMPNGSAGLQGSTTGATGSATGRTAGTATTGSGTGGGSGMATGTTGSAVTTGGGASGTGPATAGTNGATSGSTGSSGTGSNATGASASTSASTGTSGGRDAGTPDARADGASTRGDASSLDASTSGRDGSGTSDVEVADVRLTDAGAYPRTGWTAVYGCVTPTGACPAKNAADTGDVETNAFDGNYQTRWSTGVYQSALNQQNKFPLYFTVDMKEVVSVGKITTHPGCKDIYDSPGTIEVYLSTDGTNFTLATPMPHTPAVPPNGEACPPRANAVATDTITFASTPARYVQLKGTQRTTSDRYWAIGEMNVYP